MKYIFAPLGGKCANGFALIGFSFEVGAEGLIHDKQEGLQMCTLFAHHLIQLIQ